MKQTAVEFIAQELSKQIDNNLFMEVTFNKLLEQAIEMEKKQLVDFTYLIADDLACGVYTKKHIEDMFDETFKSE